MKNGRGAFLISLGLAAAIALVFFQLRNFKFILYDDPDYVTSNFHVLNGLTWSGLIWAFTTGYADNWHPITWLSHMLDAQLFGVNPSWPHLVNLLLHVANTIILFRVFQKLTGAIWKSAFVAAFFALHPLHVESVAWISERKDVLSAFFFLLTIWAYASFIEELKSNGNKQKKFYGLALSFFCLGLMTKPMLVTLPFVLLLLDCWPLRRCDFASLIKLDQMGKRLIIEKMPFFALSAVASIITFLVQKHAREPLAQLPVSMHFENALISYVRYLGKSVWPVNLSVFYPYPDYWPWVAVIFAGGLVAALSFAAIWMSRARPYFATGWFWFLGMLVPVIGLVQVGEQSMADRYSYLPLIGVFIIAIWAASELTERLGLPQTVCGMIGAILLAGCALRASDQLQYWRNDELLFRHAIAVTKKNYSAYIDLGSALSSQGLNDDASNCFHTAIEINPNSFDAYNNLGTLLVKQAKIQDAEICFRKALEINPRSADALNNLGVIFARQGKIIESKTLFEKSIQCKPDYADAYNNLGQVLAASGNTGEAISCYRTVLKLAPDFAKVRNNLAVQLSREGKFEEAITYYNQELKINPEQPQVHFNLGNALALLGQRDKAIAQFSEALRLNPDFSQAKQQLSALDTSTNVLPMPPPAGK